MNIGAIRKVLDGAVEAGVVAGLAAAVTDEAGTLFEGASGVTELGGVRPVGADTLFWIASMTKPVTSVAAMQLVERGRLALDAPVGAWLPELARPMIFQDGELRPARRAVTLRHLLTHTAGFSYPFASADYVVWLEMHPETPSLSTRAGLALPLLFEPGERWEYGIATDWVGLAVEAASGQTLEDYFREHIFAPLGMADTGFLPGEAQIAGRAVMHQREAGGGLRAAPEPHKRPRMFSGGGGLYSTLRDYCKFARMLLAGGGGILRPETVAEMTRNQIGALRAGAMPTLDPDLFTGADVNPGMDSKWGLGFLIYPEDGRFGRRAGSYGWAGMANTYFWVDPAVNLAAVIMMQLLPSGDAAALKTLLGFERAVYARAA